MLSYQSPHIHIHLYVFDNFGILKQNIAFVLID